MRYATYPHACVNQFETSDLALASFLRCREFRIQRIEAEGGKALFVFGASPALRDALVDYANDAAVPVHTLSETMRHLKSVSRQMLGSREKLDRTAVKSVGYARRRSLHPRPTTAWLNALFGTSRRPRRATPQPPPGRP